MVRFLHAALGLPGTPSVALDLARRTPITDFGCYFKFLRRRSAPP